MRDPMPDKSAFPVCAATGDSWPSSKEGHHVSFSRPYLFYSL